MKTLKLSLLLLVIVASLYSCKKEDVYDTDNDPVPGSDITWISSLVGGTFAMYGNYHSTYMDTNLQYTTVDYEVWDTVVVSFDTMTNTCIVDGSTYPKSTINDTVVNYRVFNGPFYSNEGYYFNRNENDSIGYSSSNMTHTSNATITMRGYRIQ